MYNAICSICQARHTVKRDNKGWVDIERCSKCDKIKTFQGQLLTSADAHLYKKREVKRRAH